METRRPGVDYYCPLLQSPLSAHAVRDLHAIPDTLWAFKPNIREIILNTLRTLTKNCYKRRFYVTFHDVSTVSP